jgi:hypothetical protein
LNALTTGVAIRIELSRVEPNIATATSGVAYVNEDKLEFPFHDEEGLAHSYKIPGVLASVLESNTEYADCTVGAPLTFVDAIQAHCFGQGGTTLEGPLLATRKAARKLLKK